MVRRRQSPLTEYEQGIREMKTKGFINGKWVSAISGKEFAVTNPANNETIAMVADMGKADCLAAIDAAHAALPAWRALTAKERSSRLKSWFDLILKNADELAALMTAEQGKPLAEAKGEVIYGASFVEWFAEEAKRVYGDVIPSPVSGRKLLVFKEPIGVCAAITPWNFPLAMITRKCAPAIAAGCTVVVKPAEATPLTALALADLADQAGIPAGVFNVIVGDAAAAPEIGQVLCADPRVRKVSFTGSTEVGRILLRQSADTVKKLSLELGGNAPFLVFDDADIDAAVEGAMASKYRNAGQTCVCANRIYVQAGVYDVFAKKLAEKVAQLRVGPGTQSGGPDWPAD
jgi:succinate-semialdehyde dehydrogenase/glutarate-semialdehyde dehydrogenase